LSREDITVEHKEIPISVDPAFRGATLINHELSTNGILYADVALDLTSVPFEDVALLPLMCRMMGESTASRDRVSLSRTIQARTGGIDTSFTVSPAGTGTSRHQVNDPDDISAHFMIRGKATVDRTDDLLGIMSEVLLEGNLTDQGRAVEMLRESVAGMQANVVQNGHSYAVSRISAQTSLPGYISELTGGISSYATTQQLLEQAQSDSDVDGWPVLRRRLETMREALLSNSAGTLINLTADADGLAEVRERHLPGFMDTIGSRASQHKPAQSDWGHGARLHEARSEGFSVPTQVNYVGLGGLLYNPGEEVHGSSAVALSMLRTGIFGIKCE